MITPQFWIGFAVCMILWVSVLWYRTIPEYTVIYQHECAKDKVSINLYNGI